MLTFGCHLKKRGVIQMFGDNHRSPYCLFLGCLICVYGWSINRGSLLCRRYQRIYLAYLSEDCKYLGWKSYGFCLARCIEILLLLARKFENVFLGSLPSRFHQHQSYEG